MARPALLITGASTGIGEACARYFSSRGFRVYAGVRRDADAERLRGGDLVPIRLDVTDAESIRAAVDTLNGEGVTALAGLINNAGIAVCAPIECVPVEEFRRQFEINVTGVVAVTQAFLPLVRRGGGRIVNMSSISGRITVPFLGPYSASKFALEALSDALRMELKPWGVPVAVIEPGPIATPIWEKSRRTADALLARVPAACRNLYEKALQRFAQAMERSAGSAIPVDAVIIAVARAMLAERPRPRYLVGRSARIAAFLFRFYPDRLRDRLILRGLGIE